MSSMYDLDDLLDENKTTLDIERPQRRSESKIDDQSTFNPMKLNDVIVVASPEGDNRGVESFTTKPGDITKITVTEYAIQLRPPIFNRALVSEGIEKYGESVLVRTEAGMFDACWLLDSTLYGSFHSRENVPAVYDMSTGIWMRLARYNPLCLTHHQYQMSDIDARINDERASTMLLFGYNVLKTLLDGKVEPKQLLQSLNKEIDQECFRRNVPNTFSDDETFGRKAHWEKDYSSHLGTPHWRVNGVNLNVFDLLDHFGLVQRKATMS